MKGLMAAAIRDDDPVCVFNHKLLMSVRSEHDVPEDPYVLPIGKARVVREGTDITLIGIGITTTTCRKAADELEGHGYSAEVIDLLSISPLDTETIVESVKKTRGVVVVDEDYPRCSVSSDVSALVAEEAFDYLNAPPRRVTPPHTSVPYSPALEKLYLPSQDKVVAAALEVLQ
jgi:pyruvate dehydrogenase E1 component beta subunit